MAFFGSGGGVRVDRGRGMRGQRKHAKTMQQVVGSVRDADAILHEITLASREQG